MPAQSRIFLAVPPAIRTDRSRVKESKGFEVGVLSVTAFSGQGRDPIHPPSDVSRTLMDKWPFGSILDTLHELACDSFASEMTWPS